MEKKKPGRPKSKTPIRDKRVNFRVTSDELEKIQKVCIDYDMTYADLILIAVEKMDPTT